MRKITLLIVVLGLFLCGCGQTIIEAGDGRVKLQGYLLGNTTVAMEQVLPDGTHNTLAIGRSKDELYKVLESLGTSGIKAAATGGAGAF